MNAFEVYTWLLIASAAILSALVSLFFPVTNTTNEVLMICHPLWTNHLFNWM